MYVGAAMYKLYNIGDSMSELNSLILLLKLGLPKMKINSKIYVNNLKFNFSFTYSVIV